MTIDKKDEKFIEISRFFGTFLAVRAFWLLTFANFAKLFERNKDEFTSSMTAPAQRLSKSRHLAMM
ncbi:hypothetical protein RO21_06445 [[Actinobacillus] muris]|uniref:Uncharacterized protein n=1 Tax=Muribacter muris TaxID=67855 RepID=A0A0J5P4T1_9PAST|nr:hypothetical protein [Muribacter muris]KMK51438.1 hypothetical protein RO21_06445 [[Actinobacillus] muris] [Muribacter muris]